VYGGVKAKALFAAHDVVVNGFGYTDDLQAALRQAIGNVHAAVAAYHHQRIEPQGADVL
jgi:S-adenosylmethionine/arginine decarboxylase-like enzyme